MSIDKTLVLLFHITNELYRKPSAQEPPFSSINITELLRLASENNLLYYTAKAMLTTHVDRLDNKTMLLLRRITDLGDRKLERLEFTMRTLNDVLGDYVLFKTYRGYPRIPTDVDILVHNYGEALKRLANVGMTFLDRFDTISQAMLLDMANMVKVHVQGKVGWHGSSFIDDQMIWKRAKYANFVGVNVKVPDADTDLLIHLAHINFETLHLTLSDLLHFYRLCRCADLSTELSQAKKYSWQKALRRTLAMLDDIHEYIYLAPCIPADIISIKKRRLPLEGLTFPFCLPRTHIIATFMEKRLFNAVGKSFLKSMQVLFTGKTHRPYYTPTEQKILSQSLQIYSS